MKRKLKRNAYVFLNECGKYYIVNEQKVLSAMTFRSRKFCKVSFSSFPIDSFVRIIPH